MRFAYDALSNRTDCWLPGGRHVQWLYYGSGHLHQILADGQVVSDIKRDALPQEIQRTQGTLTSRYCWNPIGSLTTHKVSQQGALQGQPGRPSPQALLESEWRSEEHCNVQVETETAQASFATYYYQCDQIGAPRSSPTKPAASSGPPATRSRARPISCSTCA